MIFFNFKHGQKGQAKKTGNLQQEKTNSAQSIIETVDFLKEVLKSRTLVI